MQTLTDMIRELPPELQEKAEAKLLKLLEETKPPELRSPKGQFTCFACQRERPSRLWGGTILGKRICKFCSLYVDEDDIRGMIAFDREGR